MQKKTKRPVSLRPSSKLGTRLELGSASQDFIADDYLDEYGIPSGLRFTDDQLWVGAMGASFPPYYAKGGFGPSAYASTTFTASRDATITVPRLPDTDEAMDFGHVDTGLAREAETLVWRPILDWIMAHRENRP